ncbi:MAG: hypothetical protein JSS27_04350 [Planctomycetes bacterium]|nr:hypothetical protein [Planctomycetota bacterium]
MAAATSKTDLLNREFLEIRAKILELAAALDRLDRAAGALPGDERMPRIARGLAELQAREPMRAERVQQIFSLGFDAEWRTKMDVDSGRK